MDEVIECRLVVAKRLGEVPSVVWQEKIEMGSKMITLCEYISGLVEHDEHHRVQIEEFLVAKGMGVLKQKV